MYVTDGQTERQTDKRKSDLNSRVYYVTLAKTFSLSSSSLCKSMLGASICTEQRDSAYKSQHLNHR